jgi:uncharacterized protein (TIGR04255 family)
MSDITFRNAPLVEIVTELRWQSAQGKVPILSPEGAAQPQFSLIVASQLDAFLSRFGIEMGHHGFRRVERLFPPGIPMIPGQVVSRFKSDSENVTVLYQLGSGVFTANATPPYRTWQGFLPEVEKGLAALLAARDPSESETPFSTVSLRYIDAFNTTLNRGKDSHAFLSDILNFKLELPEAITKYRMVDRPLKPYLTLSVPVNGGVLTLNYGEVLVSGKEAILLDITRSVVGSVAADKQAVIDVLNASHTVLQDVFLELTKPIRSLMQPEQ